MRQIKQFIAVLLLLGALNGSVWAESRSVTLRVSCTVLPTLQLPKIDPAEAALSSRVYAGEDYRVQESLVQTASGKIKLYSITLL